MNRDSGDATRKIRQELELLPDDAVRGLLRTLESARLQDMPCSEVFTRLDEYVEKELRDHEAEKLMPLLREHFDICHDCCEEYEALLSALEHSELDGQAPSPKSG